MDNYEKYAISVIIVFGALIIGGLMAAGIATADKAMFLYAFGGSIAAWASGFSVLFNKPKVYGVLILAAILLCAASVTELVS